MFAACSPDADPPPLSDLEAGPDRPFIPPPDTGGDTNKPDTNVPDTSTVPDTGPDTSLACYGFDGGCNNVTVCGAKIYQNNVNMTMPAATGGDVVDGTYILTDYTSYSNTPPFQTSTTVWLRETLVIKGLRIERIGEDYTGISSLNTASINVTYELADGAVAVDAATPPFDAGDGGDGGDAADATVPPGGSYMAFDYACAPNSLTGVPYTVSGSKLIFNFTNNQKPTQLTYTKQ